MGSKGGGGVDVMTGATGIDTFFYADYIGDANADSGVGAGLRDIITDFVQGTDKIDLSDIDADVVTAGNQAFSFINGAAFSDPPFLTGEVRFDQTGGNTIIQVDRVSDGNFTADFEIQLNGLFTLTIADFAL